MLNSLEGINERNVGHMEIYTTDEVDRRMVVNFITLRESQEYELTSHLMEFIVYYNSVVSTEKQVDAETVFNYYYRNIMKPQSVEVFLQDANVEIDAIRFIEQYYESFVRIIGNNEAMIIDRNKDYDRDKYLKVMNYLLEKYRDKKEVRQIIRYLKVHGLRDKELSDDYVRRIVRKIYEVS